MSRSRKLLLSMLGSILLHCLLAALLVSGVLLPGTRATSDEEEFAEREPEEVVVMLSDVLSEPVTDEGEKMFVRTDADSESEKAPEESRFESDRNTLAATELPAKSEPDSLEKMPTIAGRVDIPGRELRDRKFSDGEDAGDTSIELPAPGSPAVSVSRGTSADYAQTSPSVPTESKTRTANEVADGLKEEQGTREEKVASKSLVAADEMQRPPEPTKEEARDETIADASRNPILGNVPVVMAVEGKAENNEPTTKIPRSTQHIGSTPGPKNVEKKAEGKTSTAAAAGAIGNRSAPESVSESSVRDAMAANSSSASASGETPSLRPETIANRVSGTLSNLGNRASVDAEATELGRYKQSVVTAIETSWHRFRLSNRDDVTAGNLRLRFRVDSKGQVRNLKIVRDEANIGMTEFTLKAILAAKIPSMPAEVAGLLGSDGLVMNYTVMVVY